MSSLQKVLASNASFSVLTGLFLILKHDYTAALFGVDAAPFFFYLGWALLVFSGTVFLEVKKLRKKFISIIIIQDVLWVLASITICIFPIFPLSIIAYYIIAIVALFVAVFASLQYKWSRFIA